MYDEQATSDRIRLDGLELREVYEGTIANTVAALNQDLYVILPQFQGDGELLHRSGPCYGWDRRSDGSYPTQGNKVLIAVSDDGNYWVLSWSPYA